jgi:hypothetical protein
VWRSSRYLLLAVCVLVAGCGGSRSHTYDAQEVRNVFRANGFKVDVSDARSIHGYFGKQGGTVLGLLKLFSGGELEGVRAVVSERSSGELGVTAWILDSEERADSWERGWSRTNNFVTRLQKGNVVVLVPKGEERKARAAVEDLD